MTVSLRLGGGGAPSVAKVDEAFISNVPISEDTPSLLEDRYWRRAGGVKPKKDSIFNQLESEEEGHNTLNGGCHNFKLK